MARIFLRFSRELRIQTRTELFGHFGLFIAEAYFPRIRRDERTLTSWTDGLVDLSFFSHFINVIPQLTEDTTVQTQLVKCSSFFTSFWIIFIFYDASWFICQLLVYFKADKSLIIRRSQCWVCFIDYCIFVYSVFFLAVICHGLF